MALIFNVGDKVKLKKPHPCGSYIWEIVRTGADFRIKCDQCGHIVWIPRTSFEKSVKETLGQ